MSYVVYLHGEVSERLRRMRSDRRRQILAIIHALAERPHQPADYEEVEAGGRPLAVKIVAGYAIVYHIDDPVKELKITDLRRADA
jgi:mRNA-degrading endonuclease RelE of RelBE toxin-antitoxin system